MTIIIVYSVTENGEIKKTKNIINIIMIIVGMILKAKGNFKNR